MEFPTKLHFKPAQAVKAIAIVLVALALLITAYRFFTDGMSSSLSFGVAPMMNQYAVTKDAMMGGGYPADGPMLSERNVMMPQPGAPTTGSDAENFEVTSYSASIESRDVEQTCGAIESWKGKDYVIFESANRYDEGCHYCFKVEQGHTEEILAALQALDPKNLSQNTYTIKRQIEDFTSETEILTRKKESIESTLSDALKAYDQITRLATDARDVENLAKIIESKIRIIEQLTQERISVNEQLDRLSRSKAEQLDRLEYTYFNVSVTENTYINGEQIRESWQAAVRKFVRDVNEIAQGLTINLLALVFMALQIALYGVLVLVLAKYGWRLAKYIWNK